MIRSYEVEYDVSAKSHGAAKYQVYQGFFADFVESFADFLRGFNPRVRLCAPRGVYAFVKEYYGLVFRVGQVVRTRCGDLGMVCEPPWSGSDKVWVYTDANGQNPYHPAELRYAEATDGEKVKRSRGEE